MSFGLKLFGISSMLFIAHFAIRTFFIESELHFMVPVTYFILWLLTFLFHVFLSNKKEKSPKTFVNIYMGAIGVKMFVSLLVFFAIGFIFKEDLIEIAIAFIGSYLIFSGMETYQLIKELKSSTNNS